MASLFNKFRAARFRQAAADAENVLLPPPLPLIHLPDEPRLARTGGVDGRPMHLPVRRHLHPEQRTAPPEPILHENRVLVEAQALEDDALAVRERVCVYEYNQPEVLERCGAPADTLEFDSLFEGGNLQRAERVFRDGRAPTVHEYELTVHPDIRNSAYRQWFYFEVRHAQPGVVYKFSLVNLAKSGALFGAGLQPCVYSEIDAETHHTGWVHGGTHVRYDASTSPSAPPGTNALSFQYAFAHAHDRVFFACLPPYSYTDLVEYLDRLERDPQRGAFVRRTELCQTIAQNACDLLSITAPSRSDDKKLIVLSARVHPGEPNASWMMKGMLDYLTGPSSGAAVLRAHFVFKVVPMLNPDGVVHGNTRVNLAGWDLNRKWSSPVEKLFPTVFHLKRLLANWQTRDRVAIYCDLHGHSLHRNIFTYGCFTRRSSKRQTAAMAAAVHSDSMSHASVKNDPRVFPMIVAKHSELFAFGSCDFRVHKSKLNTARVVVNHELGVINSYTLEASFCGPDFGPRRDTQFSVWDLEDMGRAWCQSLLVYFGLLPLVRREDERRVQQESGGVDVTNGASVSSPSPLSSSELTILTPDAALLELNADILSDCEAAISELFATADLLDETDGGGDTPHAARADSCDSDLSGAEDPIPPNNASDEDDAAARPTRPPQRPANGYSSAPEEYSHGGARAVAKKLKRRASTRHKSRANGGGSKKPKKKTKRRRRVDAHREEDDDDDEGEDGGSDGGGRGRGRNGDDPDENADDRPDGGGDHAKPGDGGDDDHDDAEATAAAAAAAVAHTKAGAKRKKPKRSRHRRKDRSKGFPRGGATIAHGDRDDLVANEAETPRLADLVLPDVPGSSGGSRRQKTPPAVAANESTGDTRDDGRKWLELPPSVSRKQSKLARIVSAEPLELPPVAQPYRVVAQQQSTASRCLKKPRSAPHENEHGEDASSQEEEEAGDDDGSSSSPSEPGSVASEF